MSDKIPLEIQMEIVQRIPDIKSVIQFRSVSKAWKSVIDSKAFVTAHTLRRTHDQAHPEYLFIRTIDVGKEFVTAGVPAWSRTYSIKYVSIVDDETFPHQKVSVFVPGSFYRIIDDDPIIIGTSHGLFCLYVKGTGTAVIWNPCIKKTVAIAVPNVLNKQHLSIVVGFGVCPRNLDPKLVKITCVYDFSNLQDVSSSTQVEVFNLSSGGTWRSPLSSNLIHKSIGFGFSQVVVDGFIYWDAIDSINMVDGLRKHNIISSFDLTSEEFTKVNLPDPLALDPHASISLSDLRDSLVVLQLNNRYPRSEICSVWLMSGHGCTRSFNKLYSIDALDDNASIHKTLGFRKSGAPIIEVKNDKDYYKHELAIYEPESKIITNIGIFGLNGSFSVYSYKETLLLLGH